DPGLRHRAKPYPRCGPDRDWVKHKPQDLLTRAIAAVLATDRASAAMSRPGRRSGSASGPSSKPSGAFPSAGNPPEWRGGWETSEQLRILLSGMSNMLVSVITGALARFPDMIVAGRADAGDDLNSKIRATQADAVMMPSSDPGRIATFE